jgi:mutator protein MutT
VGAVVFNDGCVLLVKRGHEPLKGEWSLPGGAVDAGETLHDAVVREVLEETGLHVNVIQLVEIVERITRDDESRVQYHFVIADYLCGLNRLNRGTLACASDADAAEWAPLDQLDGYRLTEAARNVITKALRT